MDGWSWAELWTDNYLVHYWVCTLSEQYFFSWVIIVIIACCYVSKHTSTHSLTPSFSHLYSFTQEKESTFLTDGHTHTDIHRGKRFFYILHPSFAGRRHKGCYSLCFSWKDVPSKTKRWRESCSWCIDIELGSHRRHWPRLLFFSFLFFILLYFSLQKWSEISRKTMNLEQKSLFEQNEQWKIKSPHILLGFWLRLLSNTLGTRTSWKVRKNGKEGRKARESVAIGDMPCHAMPCHGLRASTFPVRTFFFFCCASRQYMTNDTSILLY